MAAFKKDKNNMSLNGKYLEIQNDLFNLYNLQKYQFLYIYYEAYFEEIGFTMEIND